jgi:membrane fusion protein (multidrug efflux system)
MKTKAIPLFITVLLASACSMNNPQMTKEQIQSKRDEVKRLNQEIAMLEENIQEESPSVTRFHVPVSVKEMRPESFEHYIEITGRLEAEDDAFISPEMNGQIEAIHVREGEAVKAGQLLVSLNTSVIESNMREVKTGLELATKLYNKQKELWDQNIGSEMQYLEAKNTKEQAEARLATLEAQMDMARIRAPFSGVVETILMKEGELAIPGMQLIRLINLNSLKLYGNISERYLTSLRKGEKVLVSFPDAEGLTLSAPIYRVGNVIDNESRTFRIEVKIDNASRTLKPNMYSVIKVNDFSSSSAFVVPSVAIRQDIKGNYIYITDNAGKKARKRYVETGLSYEDQTMVLKGLEKGDRVIVKGFAQVSDGADIALK